MDFKMIGLLAEVPALSLLWTTRSMDADGSDSHAAVDVVMLTITMLQMKCARPHPDCNICSPHQVGYDISTSRHRRGPPTGPRSDYCLTLMGLDVRLYLSSKKTVLVNPTPQPPELVSPSPKLNRPFYLSDQEAWHKLPLENPG